jgi:Ca2+-binding RTX toxin-like protein
LIYSLNAPDGTTFDTAGTDSTATDPSAAAANGVGEIIIPAGLSSTTITIALPEQVGDAISQVSLNLRYTDSGFAIDPNSASAVYQIDGLQSPTLTGSLTPVGIPTLGADAITGTDGADLINGGWGDDNLAGAAANDLLYGEGGNDLLSGGVGDDQLDGGSGTDSLSGDEGADLLAGGIGDARLHQIVGAQHAADVIGAEGGNSIGHDKASLVVLQAEMPGEQIGLGEQRRGGAAMDDAAAVENHGVVGNGQHLMGVLLDDDGGHALIAHQATDGDKQILDNDRREALQRLIEQQQPRVEHQCTGQGEHLLLTARQCAAQIAPPLAQPGEEGIDRGQIPAAGAGHGGEVLLHRE